MLFDIHVQWHMRFEEEEVRAVALGSSWVAAVTSLNFLRIFTEGGLQVWFLNPKDYMIDLFLL